MADWRNFAATLLLEDGCIDQTETKLLKSEIYDDGIVDEDEMQFLIGLRKSAKSTCNEFEVFFFEAFKSFLLADGEIDALETELIRSVIYEDGIIDNNELEFLRDLRASASKAHPVFIELCNECNA